jgi:hypothetical protein
VANWAAKPKWGTDPLVPNTRTNKTEPVPSLIRAATLKSAAETKKRILGDMARNPRGIAS